MRIIDNGKILSEESTPVGGSVKGVYINFSTLETPEASKVQNNSIAIGNNIESSNNSSISIGSNVYSQHNGIALGQHSSASWSNSIAIGNLTWALSKNTVAIGNICSTELSSSDDGNDVLIGSDIKLIGTNTVAVGSNILCQDNSRFIGDYNVVIGSDLALCSSRSPYNNAITIGSKIVNKGYDNIAIGTNINAWEYSFQAGQNVVCESVNSVVIGRGLSVCKNVESIVIGSNIGINVNYSGAGKTSVLIGYNIATNANIDRSIAIGQNITVKDNECLAMGFQAYTNNSDVALGTYATSNYCATAVGYSASSEQFGTAVGCGSEANINCVAIGKTAEATQPNSIAIGVSTRINCIDAIAIGYNSEIGRDSRGVGSIAIGNNTCIQDNYSIAIGENANTSSGSNCIAIGHNTRTAGSECIVIGTNTNTKYSYGSIAIGLNACCESSNSVALGTNATCANDNSIQLGSSSLKSITAKVSITTTSDERDKADIEELDDRSLEFLNSIKTFTYVSNTRTSYMYDEDTLTEEEKEIRGKYGLYKYDKESHEAGTKKGTRRRIGVSAQDIQEAMISIYGNIEYANIVNDNLYDYVKNGEEIPEGVESMLGVTYENLIPFLLKGIQILSRRLERVEDALVN